MTQVIFRAEQALADAFLQAGQINKAVNIAGISQNVLPAGYDSMQPELGP